MKDTPKKESTDLWKRLEHALRMKRYLKALKLREPSARNLKGSHVLFQATDFLS